MNSLAINSSVKLCFIKSFAFLVASEYGITAIKKEIVTDEDILFDESEDKQEDLTVLLL